MPRFRTLIIVIALAAGLLAACDGTSNQIIPTVAQLPTVTPTEESFFTPTPDQEPEAIATPTPLGETDPGGDDSPCGLGELEEAMNGLDADELQTAHDDFMAAFREVGTEVAGWTLSGEPDPLAGLATTQAVPVSSVRYRRGDNQEALVLISPAPEALGVFYRACIGMGNYYRAVGSLSEDAELTIEPLVDLPPGVLVTVVEPAEDAGDTGITEFVIEAYTVPAGDVLFEYTSIPAFDELEGRDPVSREDAETLLAALVKIATELE